MSKKIVHYSNLLYCKVGEGAGVFPTDHTNHVVGQFVTNTVACNTSSVLSYDAKTGIFETLNSEYHPEASTKE